MDAAKALVPVIAKPELEMENTRNLHITTDRESRNTNDMTNDAPITGIVSSSPGRYTRRIRVRKTGRIPNNATVLSASTGPAASGIGPSSSFPGSSGITATGVGL